MSEFEDLNPKQKEVVLSLGPRIQILAHKGHSMERIEQTLVLLEGWPVGAVQLAIKMYRRKRGGRRA